jgi:hypothetical protein
MAAGATIPDVAANLFFIPSPREVADTYCSPAQLSHQLCQTPKCASCPAALGNVEYVQKGLAAHTFQAIKLDLAADTLMCCKSR